LARWRQILPRQRYVPPTRRRYVDRDEVMTTNNFDRWLVINDGRCALRSLTVTKLKTQPITTENRAK
jgi:hypothetical protein